MAVYVEKQCISSSDSDTDSTVISNCEVLNMLKLINGILNKQLETKFVMETLWRELWNRIISSLMQVNQTKMATMDVLVKMETPAGRMFTTH